MRLKKYALATDQGPILKINEDYICVDLRYNLFYILDAFGGTHRGDQIIEKISDCFSSFFEKFSGDPEVTMPFSYSPKFLIEGNALLNSMQYAHREILKFNFGKALSQKGGASGIISLFADDLLTMVSTGNCIAYLSREGKITELVHPDTLSMNINETFPLSGFGLFEELHYSVKEMRLQEDDKIILFSDGIYNFIKSEHIIKIFKQEKNLSTKILYSLFALANRKGNLDNQSGLILQF